MPCHFMSSARCSVSCREVPCHASCWEVSQVSRWLCVLWGPVVLGVQDGTIDFSEFVAMMRKGNPTFDQEITGGKARKH